MQKVLVTCYERFNQNRGNFPLVQLLTGIHQGRWREPVEALRQARAEGDDARAEKIKKSLPAFTVSAVYEGARRRENIRAYQGLVILDIDHLDTDQVDPTVWKASDSPYTLFAFRSPSGRGVKIGVDPVGADGEPLCTHALTLDRHRDTFEACRRHYEALLGVAVDPSGKDPGRLCFVSWDPEMYLDRDRVIDWGKRTPGGNEKQRTEGALSKEAFTRIRKKTTRLGKYTVGNRNNYIYRFALLCSEEQITAQEVLTFCRVKFADLPEEELRATVQSAYTHTQTCADAPDEAKKQKRDSIIFKIQAELGKRYVFRYNLVMQGVEFRRRRSPKPFRMLDRKTENSMWCELINHGIQCPLKTMQTVLMSDFVGDYHPFRDYFDKLPVWDGVTDHIARVAATVKTTNDAWWLECFRRWIVALVACATRPGVENHTVLMLDGAQGTGKTRWCCNLVPPELSDYRHSGPANPRSKDIRIGMSQCLEINLDELHALDEHELNQMKEMITTGVIRERRPYGERAEQYERVCSFTASIDSNQILTDVNGSRRFLCFHILSIDYLTPIDYAGLYSQAYALLKDAFKYWFDRSDIEELNLNNEDFRIQSPEEEFFYSYYRKPHTDDPRKQYLTSAQIIHQLCLKTFLRVTPKSTNLLSTVLKKAGFEQVRRQNLRLFVVVALTDEEIEARKKGLPDSPKNKGENTDTQGKLPL